MSPTAGEESVMREPIADVFGLIPHHLPPYPGIAVIVTLICGLAMLQKFD